MAPNLWRDERNVELLKKLWVEGLSCSQIAARIRGATRNAVIGKASRLGLSGRISGGKKGLRVKAGPRRTHANRTTLKNRILNARLRAEAARAVLIDMDTQNEIEEIALKALPDLEEGDCRFVIGKPSGTGKCFCAREKMVGSSYCLRHYLKTTTPVPMRVRPDASMNASVASAPQEKEVA